MGDRKPLTKAREEGAAETTGEAVLLEDLAPRGDVVGGSGRLRFGQEAQAPPRPSPKKKR